MFQQQSWQREFKNGQLRITFDVDMTFTQKDKCKAIFFHLCAPFRITYYIRRHTD